MKASQFKAIPRNGDGDIIDLYDVAHCITDAQRAKLTPDDWSRLQDIDEELRYMMAEFTR